MSHVPFGRTQTVIHLLIDPGCWLVDGVHKVGTAGLRLPHVHPICQATPGLVSPCTASKAGMGAQTSCPIPCLFRAVAPRGGQGRTAHGIRFRLGCAKGKPDRGEILTRCPVQLAGTSSPRGEYQAGRAVRQFMFLWGARQLVVEAYRFVSRLMSCHPISLAVQFPKESRTRRNSGGTCRIYC